MNRIIRTISLSVFAVLAVLPCHSQSSEDPLLQLVYQQGTDSVNSRISKETKVSREIAEFQGSIGAEFAGMKRWQRKYIEYMSTVQGYAEAIKAGTTVYSDALVTLRNIMDIKKAARLNPQGLGATLVMSDIYVETTVEFIKTFRTLQNAIAKGGDQNLLTGKERTQMLWSICDRLEELNDKLRMLCLCVAYYDMNDVWKRTLSGIIPRTKADVANDAFERWRKVDRVIRTMYLE